MLVNRKTYKEIYVVNRLNAFIKSRNELNAILLHMQKNNPPIYINADRKVHVEYYPK